MEYETVSMTQKLKKDIKLLIENFKQLADSIGKSSNTVSLLQIPDFPENNKYILPKNMYTEKLIINK